MLYRVIICSGIHRRSQDAQQSEENKDNMASGSQFYSLTTKFKCGLHSFCKKCAVYTKAMICNEVRERETCRHCDFRGISYCGCVVHLSINANKNHGIHRYVFNAYKPTILPADKIFIPLSFVSTTPPTQGDRGTGAYLTVAT